MIDIVVVVLQTTSGLSYFNTIVTWFSISSHNTDA